MSDDDKNRYWICDGELSAKITALNEEYHKFMGAATQLSKEVGGHPTKIVTVTSMGREWLEGFFFETNPGKGWRQPKGEDHWVPRGRSAMSKKFLEYFSDLRIDVAVVLGVIKDKKRLHLGGYPGYKTRNGVVYVHTVGEFEPIQGMTRISDIEYESIE